MCPSDRHPRHSATTIASPDFCQAFEVLDADHDGRISYKDLKLFYSSRPGGGPTDDDVIASMISAADSDHNKFVDFEEFERVLARGGGASDDEIMEEVFRVMDRDGDGPVGFEDLKKYLEGTRMGVGDEDIRAMIQMGGGDEFEGIGFEGLVKILAIDFTR